jgi:hypothetical protein
MKTIQSLTFAAVAVALLFLAPMARADDNDQQGGKGSGDARNTFTKWVTAWPNMEGIVAGDVGDGTFSGEILDSNFAVVPVTIDADYHFSGSKHSFTATVHIEQKGSKAVITGVVTEGWLKGHAVKGEYTVIECEHDGGCYQGTLDIIKSRSKD